MDSPLRAVTQIVNEFSKKKGTDQVDPGVEFPPDPEMGDVAVTFPMEASSILNQSPREIARELSKHLEKQEFVKAVEVGGPGFVNCQISNEFLINQIQSVINNDEIPFHTIERRKSVLLEFVSANPTGPLHVGHGRGAIYGDVLRNLFETHGYDVTTEYYVNNTGEQVRKLGESLQIRARQRQGDDVKLQEDHYKGDYVKEVAREVGLELDAPVERWSQKGYKLILKRIFSDLKKCEIEFNNTVYESDVAGEESRKSVLGLLRKKNYVYEQNGALFLETTQMEDDKDRVLIKQDGSPTYFFNDLVYHHKKMERSFDEYINIWGHDHHGYQDRMISGLEMLEHNRTKLEIELYQLVDLYEGDEPISMSTRGGEFVELTDLVDQVGLDPIRFNFLTKNHSRPLDFDIQLATSETEENPVYYVQYAHTRMCSIIRKAHKTENLDLSNREWSGKLTDTGHQLIMNTLTFPDTCLNALHSREPHRIAHTLMEYARKFHSYYSKHKIINPAKPNRSALRVGLVQFLKNIFRKGLSLLNVSAPEKM